MYFPNIQNFDVEAPKSYDFEWRILASADSKGPLRQEKYYFSVIRGGLGGRTVVEDVDEDKRLGGLGRGLIDILGPL